MKKLINWVVLFLLLGTSAFAKIPAKVKSHNAKPNEKVSFIPLKSKRGFAVMVNKQDPGKSMILIYDKNQNVVFKDLLTNGTTAEKKYVFSRLDVGDYTVEVVSKNHDIKAPFSVYNKGDRKIVHLN